MTYALIAVSIGLLLILFKRIRFNEKPSDDMELLMSFEIYKKKRK